MWVTDQLQLKKISIMSIIIIAHPYIYTDRDEHTQTYYSKVQTSFLIFCSCSMNDVAGLYNKYKCLARIVICHCSHITSWFKWIFTYQIL